MKWNGVHLISFLMANQFSTIDSKLYMNKVNTVPKSANKEWNIVNINNITFLLIKMLLDENCRMLS